MEGRGYALQRRLVRRFLKNNWRNIRRNPTNLRGPNFHIKVGFCET